MLVPFSLIVDRNIEPCFPNSNSKKETEKTFQKIKIPSNDRRVHNQQESSFFLNLQKNEHMIPLKQIKKNIYHQKSNITPIAIYTKNADDLRTRMQEAFSQYNNAKTF